MIHIHMITLYLLMMATVIWTLLAGGTSKKTQLTSHLKVMYYATPRNSKISQLVNFFNNENKDIEVSYCTENHPHWLLDAAMGLSLAMIYVKLILHLLLLRKQLQEISRGTLRTLL